MDVENPELLAAKEIILVFVIFVFVLKLAIIMNATCLKTVSIVHFTFVLSTQGRQVIRYLLFFIVLRVPQIQCENTDIKT